MNREPGDPILTDHPVDLRREKLMATNAKRAANIDKADANPASRSLV
jgi:hypothetical protein